MNLKQTFEEYLQEYFCSKYSVIDDMLADAFNDWLAEQDVNNIIELAEKWNKQKLDYIANTLKEIVK